MPPSELIALALENLGRRKGRVALTAVGVVIGTAAVVLLVSLATSFQRVIREQFEQFGDLTRIEVLPGFGSDEFGGFEDEEFGEGGVFSTSVLITDRSLETFRSIPGVTTVLVTDRPRTEVAIEYGRLEGFADIQGISTNDLADINLTADEGSLLLGRGTAVIGSEVATEFFPLNIRPGQPPPPTPDLMGQTLRLQLQRFDEDGNPLQRTFQVRVIGVLEGTDDQSDFTIYVPLADVEQWNQWATGTRINRQQEGYPQAIVRVENADLVDEISIQIEEQGYQVFTLQSILREVGTVSLIAQLLFGGIGAIALVVAAIGIANTMTMAILERTREIGLMKAVGATNRDVLSIFLGEAAGIGLAGGVGGVLIAWVVGRVLNAVALAFLLQDAATDGGGVDTLPQTIITTPLWLVGFALVFSMLVGLVSGLYPALRAATMVPISALKYE